VVTNLNDSAYLIAGAGGISTATAVALGEKGARMLILDISGEAAEAAADAARQAGGTALARQADLADEAQIVAAVEATLAEFGRITGLFNVAAAIGPDTIGRDSNVVDIDLDVWSRTLTVNLTGFMLTIRHALPHLIASGGGPILNTISAAAYVGEDVRPAYATSKAGILGLTRHVASKYGAQGVRCNAIAPGTVLTETLRRNLPAEALEGALDLIPYRRLGEPSDIGNAAAFLLSPEAEWITGQVLNVDGGWTMRA